MTRHRAGTDVQHRRQKLPCHFIHIGKHEEEALGGGESGGEGTRLQGAVQRTRRSALRLHFRDPDRLPEEIFAPRRRPGVDVFRHR